MNTLPSNIYYEANRVENMVKEEKKDEPLFMTKSLDYEEKKVMNLKSTTNLNEIECIKA